ncbi:hypothetical protein ACQEVG_18880 [Streptomyces sp. CA-135486]|uniref:hypothetical protein n=1 Tax=Streptomyces sp. CA-135486 TaxID=3240049 RepID=UPI003D8E3672
MRSLLASAACGVGLAGGFQLVGELGALSSGGGLGQFLLQAGDVLQCLASVVYGFADGTLGSSERSVGLVGTADGLQEL